METHDASAWFPFGDAGAYGDDGACEFVTQDLRGIYVGLKNFFYVSAADAAGGDFDQNFAVGDVGDGNFFHADDALFAVDAGVHGFGDGSQRGSGVQHGSRVAHEAAGSRNAWGGLLWVAEDNLLM